MSMNINTSTLNNDKQADLYKKLSTGKSINSAKDNAAGLAIIEKLSSQIEGLDKGTQNTYDMQNLVNTAEGGLSTISNNLQRVRELSIQASNGTLTKEDRGIIQQEIDQLLQGMNDVSKNTEFNNQKLLDGSFTNKNTASSANGTGIQISIQNTSLESLGIADFNVTEDFDISRLDSAIDQISSTRSELGAVSNSMDYTINSNDIASLNLAASKSRINDTDMAKSMSDLNKERVLNEYAIYSFKKSMETESNKVGMLFGK